MLMIYILFALELFALNNRMELSISVMDDGTIIKKVGEMDMGASAYGYFIDGLFDYGWGILEIKTGITGTNSQKLMAAGYLEGYLTANHIWNHYQNSIVTPIQDFTNKTSVLGDWFDQQQAWVEKMISQFGEIDPFWEVQGLIMDQFNGLVSGYNAKVSESVGMGVHNSKYMLKFLNTNGDLLDLYNKLFPLSIPDYNKMEINELERYVLSRGRCTAMVHVSPRLDKI